MVVRSLILLLLFVFPASAQEFALQLERRAEGATPLSSSLKRAGKRLEGRVEIAGGWISGVVERSDSGNVSLYRRARWREGRDRPQEQIEILRTAVGYRVRETGTLGSRTRTLKVSPVRLVVDALWPEAMLPTLLELDGGHVRILDVATWETDHVELLPREGRSRYLDLKGGGVTLEVDAEGKLGSFLVPGARPLSIVPKGNAIGPQGPPEGVEEVEITLDRPGKPQGRLVLPREKKVLGGVVLIADAGDRDFQGDPPGGGSALLRDLAWTLAEEGYASVRVDKRKEAPPKKSAQGFSALVSDAWAMARVLAEHPKVDGQRLALVGHGEGALVAGRLGLTLESARCVVALAPPPEPIGPALVRRMAERLRKAGESPQRLEDQLTAFEAELEALASAQSEDLEAFPDRLLHDLLQLDPARVLVDLGKPLLVLYGDQDEEVAERRRAMLRATLALGKRASYSFQLLTQADHDFLRVGRKGRESGASSPTDRARARHPALRSFVREFLAKHLSP